MRFLLINSNPENAFVAVSSKNKLTISYAGHFITDPEKQNMLKSPDKLIQCFKEISVKHGNLRDIDAISVTVGPGSFTGVRVGIAIARGAAAALGKKIIPIDNFELILYRVRRLQPEFAYCVLIPSKLPEYYYALYRNNEQLERGFLKKSELFLKIDKKTLIVGDFSDDSDEKDRYFETLRGEHLKPEAESMAELTNNKFGLGFLFEPDAVEPVYIKDFVIKNS